MKGRFVRQYYEDDGKFLKYSETAKTFRLKEGTYTDTESGAMDENLDSEVKVCIKTTSFVSKDGKENAQWVEIHKFHTEPRFKMCSARPIGGRYFETISKQIGYKEYESVEYLVKDNTGKTEYGSGSYVLVKEFESDE